MPVIIKSRIGGGIDVEIAINLFFAVGIAAGSLGAAILSRGRIELAPAPFLLLILAALAIDMGLATQAMAPASREVPLAEFFTSGFGLRIALEIFLYSAVAGLFVVPLFAAVQAWAGEDRRARVVGAVNALNYIFMVGGSLVTMILLQVAGLSEPMALVVLGVANIGAAIYLFRRLRANFLAFVLRVLWRVLYRLQVNGLENLPPASAHSVIAVNHVSFLDAPIILSLMDEPPVFAIDHGIAKRWWIRPFLSLADARPLDPARPLATRALVEEVRAGRRLVIFPEGRITVTGALMKIYDGAALIADRSEALDHARAARRPGANLFLAPRRGAGRPPVVSEDDGDVPAAATAQGSAGSPRPGAPSRGRSGALRHDVGSHFPHLRHSTHAPRRVRGGGQVARAVTDRGPGPAWRCAVVAHVSHRHQRAGAEARLDLSAGRDRRPHAAQRQRRGGDLHGAAGCRPSAGDAQLHRRRAQSRRRLRDGENQCSC